MRNTWVINFLSLFTLFFLSCTVLAQTNKSTHTELGLVVGPWLPSNYTKLTEIVSLTGVRIAPAFGAFRHEITLLGGKGKGLEVNMLTWAIRNKVGVVDDLDLFWLFGIHYMRYKPKYAYTDIVLPEESANGWFFGFGNFVGGKKLKARTEFTLAMRPGRHH